MAFLFQQKVLFKHCDPAGIVFYPRYFEMLNDVVEAFFDAELQAPFERLHRSGGVPTARIETVFKAPSRHGEQLEFSLRCTRLGRSSVDLEFDAVCKSETRLEAKSTLVHVDKAGKSTAWPAPLKAAIQSQM